MEHKEEIDKSEIAMEFIMSCIGKGFGALFKYIIAPIFMLTFGIALLPFVLLAFIITIVIFPIGFGVWLLQKTMG